MLSIQTIVHPTDFSDFSNHAFELACALAQDHGSRLIVVHVLPKAAVRRSAEKQSEAKDNLEQIKAIDPKLRLERLLLVGDPVKAICRLATKTRSRLIVMGTHGRTGLTRLLMGSVAEEVIRHAPCPVVVVKGPLRFLRRKPSAAKASIGATQRQ